MDLEGKGRGMIVVVSPKLLGGTEEKQYRLYATQIWTKNVPNTSLFGLTRS
jgi:hypothetical protein